LDQKNQIQRALDLALEMNDEEYQDNVDAYFDKFSDYLYQDLEFKD
jgi:hypothetical protein